VSDAGQIFFVTVTPTRALVGREFEAPSFYDIVHTPTEQLSPEPGSYAPESGLAGEIVLLDNTGDPDSPSFALEDAEDTTRARIGFRSRSCLGEESFIVIAGMARRDFDLPQARTTPEWGIAPPWESFSVITQRPVLAPLSTDFSLTVDGAPVDVDWDESVDWSVSGATATLGDWLPLLDRSLDLRGAIHGTNGLDSTLLATIEVPDFGMHEGPVTFASSATPHVALWGGATHYAAGLHGNCPDGCVLLSKQGNVGMRFVRPGASLRVTGIFNGLTIELFAAEGAGETATTPQGSSIVVETLDIPIPFETDDLFAVFGGPPPIVAGGCPTPANIAYLVSVEPAGVP
jgi:hypothetical protein